MASNYKKTAKDIAFDKERIKLKFKIAKLREKALYWKSIAQKAQENANQFEKLYLQSLVYLDMSPADFQELCECESEQGDSRPLNFN